LLSPQQNLLRADFIKRRVPHDFFDVAIGNLAFLQTKTVADPQYAKDGFALHGTDWRMVGRHSPCNGAKATANAAPAIRYLRVTASRSGSTMNAGAIPKGASVPRGSVQARC
jgi:hypothetical protein